MQHSVQFCCLVLICLEIFDGVCVYAVSNSHQQIAKLDTSIQIGGRWRCQVDSRQTARWLDTFGLREKREKVDTILLILLTDDYKPHHTWVNTQRWPLRNYLNGLKHQYWNTSTVFYSSGILQYASVRFLKDLARRDLFQTDSLDAMNGENMTYAQVMALERIIIDRFAVDKRQFYIDDMVYLPFGFFRVVPSDDIYELVDDTAVENMETFNVVSERMLIAQRARYVRKLMGVPLWIQMSKCQARLANENNEVFMSFVPNREFLEWIPFNWFRNMSMAHLNIYIQKFPHNSATSLLYMHRLFTCHEDLRKIANPSFLMSLTCDHILEINMMDVTFILKAFDELPEPYTIDFQIINCLHTLYVNYLNTTLTGNSARTELELLSSASDDMIKEAGGLVLATMWSEAIGNLTSKRSLFIVSIIGRQRHYRLLMVRPQNNLYSFTEIALRASNIYPGNIDEEFLTLLGALTLYLFPHYFVTMKLTPFEFAIPRLLGMETHSPVFTYPCHDEPLMAALNEKLLSVYGPTSRWTSATIRRVGCLIYLLDESDLNLLDSDYLVANNDLIYTCFRAARQFPEFTRMQSFVDGLCQGYVGKCQAYRKHRMDNVQYRFQRAFKEYYMGSKNNTRARHETFGQPTFCLLFQELGSARFVELTEIRTLSAAEFEECLDWMGSMMINDETAEPLWRTIKSVYGGPMYVPKRIQLQLGSIVRGIPPEDFDCLNLGDITVIGEFGREGLWTERDYPQLQAMARAVKRKYKREIRSYTGWDFLALGQITCGFSTNDLRQITIRSFADGLSGFASLACPVHVTRLFRDKVTHPNVLGPTKDWGPGTLRAAGSLLAGLTYRDMDDIRSCAFSGISLFAAHYMPPEVFNSFLGRQLKYITPEVGYNIYQRTMMQLNNGTRHAIISARQSIKPPDMKECLNSKWEIFKGSLTQDDAYVDAYACICGARSTFVSGRRLLLLLLFLFPLSSIFTWPS